MNTRSIMRRTLIPGVIGASLISGFAFATFTMHSEPWATGHVGTVVNPTATAVVDGDLLPGYCNDVKVTLKNDNSVPIKFDGVSSTGFRNTETRLLDFLTFKPLAVQTVLSTSTLQPGQTRTYTVPNAVCLSPDADDARQGQNLEVGLFIASHLVPGTES